MGSTGSTTGGWFGRSGVGDEGGEDVARFSLTDDAYRPTDARRCGK